MGSEVGRRRERSFSCPLRGWWPIPHPRLARSRKTRLSRTSTTGVEAHTNSTRFTRPSKGRSFTVTHTFHRYSAASCDAACNLSPLRGRERSSHSACDCGTTIIVFVETSPSAVARGLKIKIPTLSLQKAQGQGWGTRFTSSSGSAGERARATSNPTTLGPDLAWRWLL